MKSRPAATEYAPYYAGYVSRVPGSDVLAVLARQPEEIGRIGAAVAPDRELFRYAPGKWTIREVAGHMIDAERVFGHRAFCISRGERSPLPTMDEDGYVALSRYAGTPLAELLDEFAAVRASNLVVLRRLPADGWSRTGTASGNPVSVRALAYIMAGHIIHHCGVLQAKYGAPV